MIRIDTEELASMVATLQSANDAVDSAVSSLTQITEHHDWGCYEKNIINDYIRQVRSQVLQLQTDHNAFLSAARAVSHEFVDAENEIVSLFSGVEALLSRMFTNTPAAPAAASGSAFDSLNSDELTPCPVTYDLNLHDALQPIIDSWTDGLPTPTIDSSIIASLKPIPYSMMPDFTVFCPVTD